MPDRKDLFTGLFDKIQILIYPFLTLEPQHSVHQERISCNIQKILECSIKNFQNNVKNLHT